MLQEVHVLRLRHRNLVNFHHVWLENSQLTPFGPSVPTLYLLQEYCDGGDLERYILSRVETHQPTLAEMKENVRRKSRGQGELPVYQPEEVTIEMVYSFTRDIVAGLNHLHVNGIIQYVSPGVRSNVVGI
jgi:serine/threonine protein kinase